MKCLCFTLLLNSIFCVAFSQKYLEVLNAGDKNLSFKEQAKKVNHFFDTASSSNKGGYKQWKRFEWFAKHHLADDGKIENYDKKNFEIVQQVKLQRPSNTTAINGGSWTNIGYSFAFNEPLGAHQGRVNCIAFNPLNSNIIYIGTAGGGIWKSTSGGGFGTWVNISDNLPITSIAGIAIAPDGNTIYALTGDGNGAPADAITSVRHNGLGVLKSNDGGSNWHLTGLTYPTSKAFHGYKIAIHPSNSNVVIAATTGGLCRTENAGISWDTLQTGDISDFEFKPNDNNILYYTWKGNSNIAKLDLTDLSASFKLINNTFRRIEIEVTSSNPEAVYVLGGPGFSPSGPGTPNGTANYAGFYYLDNWNNQFVLRNNNINVFVSEADQSFFDICLDINPANINEIIIGGVNTCRSTDGGFNFSFINSNLHADQHAIERNPGTGNLYLGNDGGIYTSTDNGVNWSNISFNLVISEFYRISGSQGNNDLILGGTQDNGHFLRFDNTGAFNRPLGSDGMDNIIDYANPNIMYACYQNGGLNKTVNGGVNTSDWTNITGSLKGSWVTPILQSTSNSNTIFYASTTGILRSTNGGTSWASMNGFNSATALAISRFGGRLVATDGTKISVCDNPNNATAIWRSAVNPSGSAIALDISALAINAANANDIYATVSGYNREFKVLRSIDGGISYNNVTLNLPNVPVYAVAFENTLQTLNGGVYIGTEIGVFYKNDVSAGWEPFYNGLPRVPVTDLFVNFTSNDITAATFGRGLWRTQGHSNCPSTYSLSNTIYGNIFYQSSATINSAQVIPGTTGNSLKLRALNTIRLTDGFRAFNGCYFQAVNAACGSAVPLPANRIQKKSGKKISAKNKVRHKITPAVSL